MFNVEIAGIDSKGPCILQKNMFSLLLCNIYLHKWKDPAPEAQANSTIRGPPPLRQAHWVLPGQLSSLHLWDETLADSSLLNKAPSKGGGKEGTNQCGICFGKDLWDMIIIIIMGGRKTKECAPKGLETWLSTSMDCLSSFENSMQDSHPSTHLQPLALPFHFWNFAKW
jgi:hypothetical protein